MLTFAFIAITIAFSGVGILGSLNGVMARPYDPENMTLNYVRISNGPKKIVLLHGLTDSLQNWKTGLDGLPDSYSLLLLDLLFGDSSKPNIKYDIEQHLGAIEKVIKMEGFDSGDAVVTEHSLAAILMMGLVGEHPGWFQSLVVIGLPKYRGKETIKTKFGRASLWDVVSVDSRYTFVCFLHPLYMMEWFRLASRIKAKKILFIHGKKDTAAPIENVESLPIFTIANFETLPDADHQWYLADPANVWVLTGHLFSRNKNLKLIK